MMLVADLKIALLRNQHNNNAVVDDVEMKRKRKKLEVKMFINMYAPIVAMQYHNFI